MKIIAVSNLYPPDGLGGYEMGCRQIVTALHEAGHEVTVLTAAPRKPIHADERHLLRTLRLADPYAPSARNGGHPQGRAHQLALAGCCDAYNVHRFVAELERLQPDLVYFWNLWGLGGISLIAATQLLGLPWRMHIMDAVPSQLCNLTGSVRPELGRAFARLIRGRFFCCSRTVIDEIKSNGVPIGPSCDIVPNWVTTDGAPARSDWLIDCKLRIAFAGAVSLHKGADIVIEAAAQLKRDGFTRFQVDLFGPVVDPRFQAMINASRLQEHVTLQGSKPQQELWKMYEQYDLFAFPTLPREPFAFAPLEAAAHGCVPVIPHICGNAEWMLDGVDLFKTERTADGYARLFRRVIQGEIDLAKVGRQAVRQLLRDFHLKTIFPKIEAGLKQATAERRPAHASTHDIYRLALLAERSVRDMLQEAA